MHTRIVLPGAMAGAMQFAITDGLLDAGAETGESLAFDGELVFDGATAGLERRPGRVAGRQSRGLVIRA